MSRSYNQKKTGYNSVRRFVKSLIHKRRRARTRNSLSHKEYEKVSDHENPKVYAYMHWFYD